MTVLIMFALFVLMFKWALWYERGGFDTYEDDD